jgi:hypothetical protein
VFSREVRLYERSVDFRGEPVEHTLGRSIRWDRSPARPGDTRLLPLESRPFSGTLVIEIANGDNAPIKLTGVEGAFAATRLLFRCDDLPLFLYYGHAQVPSPEYDLALALDQMISAEPAEARLGQEEILKPGVDRPGGSGHGGLLLWASLGAVVLVLLIAIARLLPKPPSGG